MSTENALQLPVIETIDGEQVSFPRLELSDLIIWMNEVKASRKAACAMRVNADEKLSSFERHRLIQMTEDTDIEVGHLMARAFTPIGVQKVLMTSLTKAGKNVAEAKAILSKIHFQNQVKLSEKLMSAPEAEKKEKSESPLDVPEETGEASVPC